MSGGGEKRFLHLVGRSGSKGLASAEISGLDALDVAGVHLDMPGFAVRSQRLIGPGAKGSGLN